MSAFAFDRLVSGSDWKFDRLVDTTGVPAITSVGTVQDGTAITITGTSFSASGNTVFLVQGDTVVPIAVASEGTTSITTVNLDTGGLYLTQPLSIYVLNNSAVSSNFVMASILPASGAAAYAITQTFLGDPTTRGSGSPDLVFSDEVRIQNVAGGSITDVTMTGQGAFKAASAVTAFDYAIQDGTGLGAFATIQWQSPVTTAVVPDVVNQTEMAADALILSAGLAPTVVALVQSTATASGHVAAQFPPAGQALVLGGTVELTISLGSTQTIVPVLTGLKRSDAEAQRLASGLTGVTYRYIDGINSDYILNQSVTPGTLVDIGAAVDIVVSSNLAPNVLGLIVQDAESILLAANLTLARQAAVYDPTAPLDTVVSQSPLPDTIVTPGATIFITLSLGPPPPIPGATPQRRRIANIYD